MIVEEFIPRLYTKKVEKGAFSWQSPSNIALIKYWGKKEHQIPENPSISFTLNNCKTITTLSFESRDLSTSLNETSEFSFDVFLDGEQKNSFKPKINTFFKRVETYLPFLSDFHFKIETRNTFPHSSGIASSASGMSALALCLMSLEKMFQPEMSDGFFLRKSSFLARLGSGSACRSIGGDLIVWGENETVVGSSNLIGVKYPFKVHDVFKRYQDTILLVDKGEKQVSSTVGHNLMHNHPYAHNRFKQAHDNFRALKPILEQGDLEKFIEIVESEALTLHAMMMTSMPYFILMKPNTLKIINKIWSFRKETNLPICFTLDAGANVHVLYPKKQSDVILDFIKNELVRFCQNEQFICDEVGLGAKQL